MHVTPQHNLRWSHHKAGLSRFGSAGCLTERGIVHQGVARQEKARSYLYCATPLMLRGPRRSSGRAKTR